MDTVYSSTPQLPVKEPQIPSNRDHKALNRATLGGLGYKGCFRMHGLGCQCQRCFVNVLCWGSNLQSKIGVSRMLGALSRFRLRVPTVVWFLVQGLKLEIPNLGLWPLHVLASNAGVFRIPGSRCQTFCLACCAGVLENLALWALKFSAWNAWTPFINPGFGCRCLLIVNNVSRCGR